MLKRPRIYGLGTIVVDHQVVLERLPEADTKGEVVDDRFQVGGPVPTALALLRTLGCETVFQGRWADDRFGRMIEDDLAAAQIGFDTPSQRRDSKTGFAHVWIEEATGKRSIAAFRGSHQVEEREVHPAALADFDSLHLDGWSTDAAIKAARTMRGQGGRVFVDLGSPKPRLAGLLEQVHLLNCPLRLLHQLFETDDIAKGARELMRMGPEEVTVTDGENGATYFNRSGITLHQPALPVRAIDTNGAGDTFAGAFHFASLQDWTPARRLQFAGTAAALKCQAMGNRDALPTFEAVDEVAKSMPLPR